MSEPVQHPWTIQQLWHDFGVPGAISLFGLILGWWVRKREKTKERRAAELERQAREQRDRELMSQALILNIETMWGVLAVLQALPCVSGECATAIDADQRLPEEDRTQLAILKHDIDAMLEKLGRKPKTEE